MTTNRGAVISPRQWMVNKGEEIVTCVQVSEGSPADTAGLTVGDLILSFGEVDISHPRGLTGVVDVVREKEGQQVPVTVLRHGSEATTLTLVPKTWDGRGLLGVHLLPS